ncbi:PREDICTED: B3 domain-containing protein REM17-like [Nicotiana attenuata]|uniref:B3 domain-containing protein rem10 n=1 Tax=Nicotiana attenuata TaxID=49451 RepID=A0A1J6HXS4_NICAT|nr:PREDICTED: B3 domain-containing protein REM17-like [Nicotiana attenuata]OIS97637.1 b3 domain-containing protein rem10 [Nicotiana attenuata]
MSSHKVFPDAEASKDVPLGRPHLISAVKPHWISRSLMHVPKLFACKNGLCNRKCTIVIRDEQRSWEFRLYSCGGSTFIGGGWREFCAANFLKEGDRVMFEIFAKAEKPILKFYDLRANASLQTEAKNPDLDANRYSTQGLGIDTSGMPATKARIPASTSANANPQFISTIRPYSINRTFLYLPLDFAKSNGLMNRRCEMILTDEKQRSWSVQLGPTGHHVAITRGWTKFVKANDVQVGDTFKFELINNGTIPIAHFHCKYSEKDGKNERSI